MQSLEQQVHLPVFDAEASLYLDNHAVRQNEVRGELHDWQRC